VVVANVAKHVQARTARVSIARHISTRQLERGSVGARSSTCSGCLTASDPIPRWSCRHLDVVRRRRDHGRPRRAVALGRDSRLPAPELVEHDARAIFTVEPVSATIRELNRSAPGGNVSSSSGPT
jgi:hypothetical protein